VAREAGLVRLSDFLRELNGKDCIIFGSAPAPKLGSKGYRGEKIVCCNGSSFSLKRLFGLEPDFSFIHGHVLTRDNPADEDVRSVLAQVGNVGRVVFLDQLMLYPHEPGVLGAKAPATVSFAWDDRYHLFARMIGYAAPKFDISTGAFSVAATLFAGAKSVRLVGFSFDQKGHSYNNNGRYRNHVSSDAALYVLLSLHGYSLAATTLPWT
jgi:hypothetical protein